MARSSFAASRKHWSLSEAKAVLGELASSGLSMTEFCRQRGLHAARLYRWARRVGREGGLQLPAFLPVSVGGRETPLPPSATVVEVAVGNEWVVRVPAGCGTDILLSVFTALREVPSC